MQEQAKYNVYYTSRSKQDLNEIWDHIAIELQNIPAAERILAQIMDDVDQLSDHARLGAPLSSITDTKSDYRFLVTEKYLTFYRILGNEIHIERVFYGRRDYLQVLFGDVPSEP